MPPSWINMRNIAVFNIYLQVPHKLFFHVPCPGRGTTKAYFSVLHLDFQAAFEYHPLFFGGTAVVILYIAYRNVLKKRLSNHTEIILLIIMLFLFVTVYIVKLITEIAK